METSRELLHAIDAEMAWLRYSSGLKEYRDMKTPFLRELAAAAFKRGYITAREEAEAKACV